MNDLHDSVFGAELLSAARSVLIVDWPSRDVPDTLAAAGFAVTVKSGPGADDFSTLQLRNGGAGVGACHCPEAVDIVYVHRPIEEFSDILQLARRLDAKAVWYQSGLGENHEKGPTGCWLSDEVCRDLRARVEAAGMRFIAKSYIADVARGLKAR
jgi:hypothetical protein